MRISDWSSDVCSSDLVALRLGLAVALEQQQRIVGIGADCRQRLVELVAERCRHLAERGELAGLHQIVLRAPAVGSALLDAALELFRRAALVFDALDQAGAEIGRATV